MSDGKVDWCIDHDVPMIECDKHTREVSLEEIAKKDLSDDIIDKMAEDQENTTNYVVFLSDLNEMQTQLLIRVMRTLKVDAHWMLGSELYSEQEETDA